MRIAISGIRGVPANFGGSETAAEEIGRRLAAAGHSVVVYCRKHNSTTSAEWYQGMRRVVLPSINRFNFDTISHSALAALHMRFRDTADIMHFHGVGNALLIPLLWGSGKRVVVTIDGPDWERPKWGRLARFALKLGARMGARWADRLIIDNHPSIGYFKREFGVTGTYIPYGADATLPISTDYLPSLGLTSGRYLLFVGAFVPDKGPDLLLEAFRHVVTDMPLVMVGDSPFFPEFRASIAAAAERDPRVRILGYVYGEHYRELLAGAYAYVHPLRSDGTSPALLQAMAYGKCIIVNSNAESLSAVGDTALPFKKDSAADLARVLKAVLADAALVEAYGSRARRRREFEFSWDAVAAGHLRVFSELVSVTR
jgi:glycosyltransferase involved in cell wall biosynthesis